MADSRGKELTASQGIMNGHYNVNRLPQSKSPLPNENGNGLPLKPVQSQHSPAKSIDKSLALTNGNALINPSVSKPQPLPEMKQVPEELMEMLRTRIPDDAYVPMARLISRSAKTCWSQLINVLNELAEIQPHNPQTITKRMRPPDQTVINDDSTENQRKKMKLWNFAEHHKHALIKLLVILMWSSKSEDNKLTIALNFEIHAIRSAFSTANDKLSEWIVYIVSRQDACPDLDTALEVLATGRVADVPDLGFMEAPPLTERQMLATLQRLNRALTARMVHEQNLPINMTNWRIHDGRITFKVSHEFELDLSVMEESTDAPFMLVDLRFDFRPRPPISEDLHDQLTTISNQGLVEKGLQGAYEFLHQTCLTLKLKELHSQALTLTEGLWAGHLGVELLKRTLIVQYWTTRTVTKSWLEIGIHSGRVKQDTSSTHPISFLYLRWMKDGKLVTDHEITLDLGQLSFESILNQVIAQHTNSIFDGIYEQLVVNELYANDDLDLEQDSSLIDGFDCKLRIGVSKVDEIQLSCDPVAGSLVISPPTSRSDRLQDELMQSADVVEDFITRLPALRCAIAQHALMDAMQGTSLLYLPGRKPSAAEVKSRFGSDTLRAAFFTRAGWSSEWTLAASFGRTVDRWWLVYGPTSEPSSNQVHKLATKPIHLQHSFTEEYFQSIRTIASAEITMQVSHRALEARNISVREVTEQESTRLSFSLTEGQNLESIDNKIVVWPVSSKRTSHNSAAILARVRLRASKKVLQKLASADLDPVITVHADKQLLLLSLSGRVGGDKIDELLNRLHYIDDLISCIKLVESVDSLSMRSLTMQDIIINYSTGPHIDLGLKLLFKTTTAKAELQLLPVDSNPHSIVSEHINHILATSNRPLSDRLQTILSVLTATLPLVNGLQYLQGHTDMEVPKMSSVKLEDSRKWIKVHVISRDMIRFGVHFYALTSKFPKDVESEEIPSKLLVRLEIETAINNSSSKQGWTVRPAVEEFKTYNRPSFTSQALAQRLKERVFLHNGNGGWMGLGSAARCLFENPYDLLFTIQETLVEWLKEAVVKKEEGLTTTPVQVPQVPTAKPPLQNTEPSKQGIPQARTLANPNVNNQQQRPFPQGRGGTQPMSNQNGPSRVMTAQPQQMRQPLNAGRGRGQFFQRGGQQRTVNGASGTQNDAIPLD